MTTSLQSHAEIEFALPANAPVRLRKAFLGYLAEQISSTCTPTIWPPESYQEWLKSLLKWRLK